MLRVLLFTCFVAASTCTSCSEDYIIANNGQEYLRVNGSTGHITACGGVNLCQPVALLVRCASCSSPLTPDGWTTIKWNTVEFDTHGGYDGLTGMYTTKVPGYYQINVAANMLMGTGATVTLSMAIVKEAAYTLTCDTHQTTGNGFVGTAPITCAGLLWMNAGERLSISLFYAWGSSTAKTLYSSSSANFFSLARL